jgi:hypothetical protein
MSYRNPTQTSSLRKQGEGQDAGDLPKEEESINQMSDKEELPMDRAMLLDLMVVLGMAFL